MWYLIFADGLIYFNALILHSQKEIFIPALGHLPHMIRFLSLLTGKKPLNGDMNYPSTIRKTAGNRDTLFQINSDFNDLHLLILKNVQIIG